MAKQIDIDKLYGDMDKRSEDAVLNGLKRGAERKRKAAATPSGAPRNVGATATLPATRALKGGPTPPAATASCATRRSPASPSP